MTPAAPFEIGSCERLRGKPSLSDTGIILIASVFQHTRYKRAPTSLYGADDYVEKHHIRDRLLEKITRLLPPGAGRGGELLADQSLPLAIGDDARRRRRRRGRGRSRRRD